MRDERQKEIQKGTETVLCRLDDGDFVERLCMCVRTHTHTHAHCEEL